MHDNCTLTNMNSLYSGNVVTNANAAAVYGIRWCHVTNSETIFEENTGIDGTIVLQSYCSLVNNMTTFRYYYYLK